MISRLISRLATSRDASSTADQKLRDLQHYYPQYRERLEQAIRQGTVEPFKAAMGHEMARNPRYGAGGHLVAWVWRF